MFVGANRTRLVPKPLLPGGTVGIVAPASACAEHSAVLAGIEWWKSKGYDVALGKNALLSTGWTAGTPEQRADDLMAMFTDPRIDAIQCLRGGYGSAQVIPHLDFEMIAKTPKLFIGFSDITALHSALWRAIKLVTLYGPSLTTTPSDFTGHWLLKAVRGETAQEYPADPIGPFPQCLTEGTASGTLVGGCLSDLVHTLGTPWEVDLDGAIFAFEEVGSGPHGLDRILLHLQQARKLERVRGIVVGDLAQPDVDEAGHAWVYSKTIEEMLRDRLAPLGVPVLYRLPFGHTKDFTALPLGVTATVDASHSRLIIEEPVARAT